MYNDCKVCGKPIIENLSDPNVHYGGGSTVCLNCKCISQNKEGDYMQDKNGEYHLVTSDMEKTIKKMFMGIDI